jgi:hypothetical protein
MKTFKNADGPEWQISITYAAIKRVKGIIPEVNLAGYADGKPPLSTRLVTDIELFCNTLYALCKPQCDERKLTDEQFGAALGGDAIYAAREAFFAEWADFFRGLHQTEAVAAIRRQAELMQKATAAATQTIEAIDIDNLLAETLKNSPANLPASSALIPAP